MTKRKKNNSSLEFLSALDARLSAFFASHSSQLIILGTIFLILFFLSTFPYFNIILSKAAALFITWILAIFLLKLPARFSAFGALLFLGICPFLLIFEKEPLAESIATLAFGFLVVGALQGFVSDLKVKRRNEKRA